MHETGAVKKVLEEVVLFCKRASICPRRIVLEVGTGYTAEHLIEHLNHEKEKFPELSGARFVVKKVSGRLKCRKCGRESALEDEYEIICPVCDSADVLIEDGKDITIKTIDYDAPN
jgi:Zn finger protein HypA/HybF involved in hydrogenase expression